MGQNQTKLSLKKIYKSRYTNSDKDSKEEHYENDEDIQSSVKMKRNKKTIKEIRK